MDVLYCARATGRHTQPRWAWVEIPHFNWRLFLRITVLVPHILLICQLFSKFWTQKSLTAMSWDDRAIKLARPTGQAHGCVSGQHCPFLWAEALHMPPAPKFALAWPTFPVAPASLHLCDLPVRRTPCCDVTAPRGST